MFIAKFSQTNSSKFKANHRQIMPFIGTVVAGIAEGSIIDGTMFESQQLEPNQLYLCDNYVDPGYPDNVQTTVIAKVSIIEFMELRKTLGAGKLVREAVNANDIAAEA